MKNLLLPELEDVSIELEDQESEQADETSTVTEISDYATFLSCFKVLEGYAQTYAEENAGEDANALIINYIRTGVERYTSGTWEMVCGKENTAFTAYVSEQDTANNTSASALKNIKTLHCPMAILLTLAMCLARWMWPIMPRCRA